MFLGIGEKCSSQNGEPLATIEEEGFALHYDGSINDATRDGAGLYLRISFVRMQLALILIINQKFGSREGAGLVLRTNVLVTNPFPANLDALRNFASPKTFTSRSAIP